MSGNRFLPLQEEHSQNISTQPKNEEKKKKNKAFGSTHKQVPASSSHPKECEEELRTMAFSPSSSTNISTEPKNEEKKKKKNKRNKKAFGSKVPASSSHPKESEEDLRSMASLPSYVTKRWDRRLFSRRSRASESLTLKHKQIQASQAQIGMVYVPLPTCVAKDMEVEKGERSVFLCITKSTEGHHWCDLYRIDQMRKECSKIFGRLEWGKSTRKFGAATIGSTIYILGGLYPESCPARSQPDSSFCNDVFYLDVHHPQDGWKVGPQLPSPHFDPVTTSMNGTIYIFNGKYVFARALDTCDSKPSWKPLRESPPLASPLRFVMAFPDPKRDRILLYSVKRGFFAYHPRNGELECVRSEIYMHSHRITTASALVDGVLYHNEYRSNMLLSAYDLDEGKRLIPFYTFNVDIAQFRYRRYPDWDHLLDLGGGKLCLVRSTGGEKEAILFLKLKVQKEYIDAVRITVVSFDIFRVVEDGSCFEHSFAL